MKKIFLSLILSFGFLFAQEFQTYKKGNIFIFKIKEGEEVKLPSTSLYLKVYDIKDGKAYIRIYDKGSGETSVIHEEKYKMPLSEVMETAYLLKKECKTDKILEKKNFLNFKALTCTSSKKECSNANVYSEEICRTYIFPALEFGQYYTKGWAFNISAITDKYIVISFMLRKMTEKKVPVY